MQGSGLSGEQATPPSAEMGTPWWARAQSLLLGGAFAALTSLILVMQLLPTNQLPLDVGDVSPTDVRAPARKAFISQVLTQQERSRAEGAVPDVYDPPSARIAREQITRLRSLFDYFASIRSDPYPSRPEKVALIQAIPDLNLSAATIGHLLDLKAGDWKIVTDQSSFVLDQAMRKEIRDQQLGEVKRALPALVSLDLTELQADVVISLVRELVRPNTLYNAERTAAVKRLARDSVNPTTETIEKGETILRAGDLVTPEAAEALDVFGLRHVQPQWPTMAGNVLFAIAISAILGLYIRRFTPSTFDNQQHTSLLFTLLVVFILGAKLVVTGHTVIPYLYPAAALSILTVVFFGTEMAVGVTICLALIIGVMSNGSLELTTYVLLGGLAASLRLVRMERVTVLLWSGVYVALANAGVVLAFRLPSQNWDTVGLATLLSVALINGVLSASLALIGFLLLGNLFGITTSLQLIDLARPTHPLLRQLLLKAPGTYHHSLLVSNLAEQAAERIGADDLLARVGAYYHDIGKTLRPYFFVDNQIDGVNVHDRLDPETSAQIVVSHVKDGLDLARKYSLPKAIQDFIGQHHGTTITNYFYRQAVQAHSGPEMVDRDRFTYPGPRPRRKEIGIVMLADSCEAAVRGQRPASPKPSMIWCEDHHRAPGVGRAERQRSDHARSGYDPRFFRQHPAGRVPPPRQVPGGLDRTEGRAGQGFNFEPGRPGSIA